MNIQLISAINTPVGKGSLLTEAVEELHDGFAVLEAVRNIDGVIKNFRFLYINKSGSKYYGLPGDYIIGRYLSEIYQFLPRIILRN